MELLGRVARGSPRRRRERLHHRDDKWRRVVLEVQRERDRRGPGALAADERAGGAGAAEMADQLDADGSVYCSTPRAYPDVTSRGVRPKVIISFSIPR